MVRIGAMHRIIRLSWTLVRCARLLPCLRWFTFFNVRSNSCLLGRWFWNRSCLVFERTHHRHIYDTGLNFLGRLNKNIFPLVISKFVGSKFLLVLLERWWAHSSIVVHLICFDALEVSFKLVWVRLSATLRCNRSRWIWFFSSFATWIRKGRCNQLVEIVQFSINFFLRLLPSNCRFLFLTSDSWTKDVGNFWTGTRLRRGRSNRSGILWLKLSHSFGEWSNCSFNLTVWFNRFAIVHVKPCLFFFLFKIRIQKRVPFRFVLKKLYTLYRIRMQTSVLRKRGKNRTMILIEIATIERCRIFFVILIFWLFLLLFWFSLFYQFHLFWRLLWKNLKGIKYIVGLVMDRFEHVVGFFVFHLLDLCPFFLEFVLDLRSIHWRLREKHFGVECCLLFRRLFRV